MILIYSAFTQAFGCDIAQYYMAQHTLILQCKLVLIQTELNCARLTHPCNFWHAGLVRFSVPQHFTIVYKNIKHHKN